MFKLHFQNKACFLKNITTDLLPLVNVADESGQAKQSQQAQDFGKADDTQRPGCPVHLRVQTVHHQEDVVDWDGRHKIHEEPALQVVLTDRPALENGRKSSDIWCEANRLQGGGTELYRTCECFLRPGVQYYLSVVFLDDACPEVENQVNHEKCVRDHVEDDP